MKYQGLAIRVTQRQATEYLRETKRAWQDVRGMSLWRELGRTGSVGCAQGTVEHVQIRRCFVLLVTKGSIFQRRTLVWNGGLRCLRILFVLLFAERALSRQRSVPRALVGISFGIILVC